MCPKVLEFFLSESGWDAHSVNARRLQLLREDSATKPHEDGVLVIDESGDRKDGKNTAHVAHQYLSSVGRVANGIVSVSSVWADESVYYPLHIEPYEPAERLPRGKADPALCAPRRRSGWNWSIGHEKKRASLSGRWWPTLRLRGEP